MRKSLQNIEEVRATFTGEFVRFGVKNGYKGPEETLLVKTITDQDGKIVADHLWFNLTKGFQKLNLSEGDLVQFDARVKEYLKGYFGRRDDVYKPAEIDYKLSHPTKLKVLSRREPTE